ncbi:MAG: ATP-dependent zinc protease [Xanthomonadales bacterium]|nr:ATP-dependent zinc protease [Xanthomonadales bacterium]
MAEGILGWREWVSLPALGVSAVKAKVDTGARSSALHVLWQERFEAAGQPWVRFEVESMGAGTERIRCEAPVEDERPVTDSGGHTILRPFIRTELLVGERRYPIELNLVERHRMRFAMLLGRTALEGNFLVDPGRSYVSGRTHAPPRKARKRLATGS